MSEKKPEFKKYYLSKDGEHISMISLGEGQTVLVDEVEYKKVVAENKVLDRILKQKVELIDKKNKEIDEMSDEKKVVSETAFNELNAKYQDAVKLLKKLGAYRGT